MAYAPGTNGSQGTIKGKPFRDAIVALIHRHPDDLLTDKPKTVAQEIVLQLVKSARKGDQKAITELIDRVEGKPKQALIGGDDDDKPLIPPALPPASKEIIERYEKNVVQAYLAQKETHVESK